MYEFNLVIVLAYGYAGDVQSAERVWKPILDDMISKKRKTDGIQLDVLTCSEILELNVESVFSQSWKL